MKDYFAVLEISTEVSTKEIKQAYFKMIRKYHPDRYPEEFMKIREAYEMLSNEQTREEYREFAQMDDFTKLNFKSAIEQMEEEDYEYAIYILSELIKHHKNNTVLQSYLGVAYLKNYNTGNAIKVFEKLVKEVPEHAGFAGYLAKSYLERGWHKKAIAAYKKALALDEDNFSLWIGLSEAYMDNRDYRSAKIVLQNALEIGKEKDWDKLTIYHYLFNLAIRQEEYEELIGYIQEIKDIIPDQEEEIERLVWLVMDIGAELLHKGESELSEKLFEEIYKLIPDNKKLKEFGYMVKKIIPVEDELELFMKDRHVKDEIKNIIQAEIYPLEKMGFYGKNKETYKKLICMEVAIGYKQCKSSLRILENQYPKLYELKKEFFNKMKDKTQRELFISHNGENKKDFEKLISIMTKNGIMGSNEEAFEELDNVDLDDAFMDEYFGGKQEPYVREQPKVGRNDPCPCGSRKKYKQCCGR